MIPFAVWIEGVPRPQPRARAFARKMGAKFVARVFDDGTAEGWKSCIADAVRPHLPAVPFDGPVKVAFAVHLPRPGSHFGKKKGVRFVKPDAPRSHVSRGDVDNFAKAALDACTRLGLWRDDAQVAELLVSKNYTDSAPGAWLRVAPRG